MMLTSLVDQIVNGPVYKPKRIAETPIEKPCARGCGRPRFKLKSGKFQSYCRECNIEISKERYRKQQREKKEAKQ